VSLREPPGLRRCVVLGAGMRLRDAIRVSSARKTGNTRNATTPGEPHEQQAKSKQSGNQPGGISRNPLNGRIH
jgi:hypothetical protein